MFSCVDDKCVVPVSDLSPCSSLAGQLVNIGINIVEKKKKKKKNMNLLGYTYKNIQ